MARKRATDGPDGILLVDKPAGWTSHDVVAKVRRLLGQPRAGHAGTLDPFATGLLVVCLGQATRLAGYVMTHEKVYEGEIVLGVTTDTADCEGAVIARRPVPPVDTVTLERVAGLFTGVIAQTPPAYSAVKVAGQRAYDLARQGKSVELAARPVEVFELRLALLAGDRLRIHVRCGPGTYVRSLARDIGEALGCGGHLARLRRLRSGRFRVEDAWAIPELERLAGEGRAGEATLPADEALLDHDCAILGTPGREAFLHGNVHSAGTAVRPAAAARVYGTDGAFLGVGAVDASGRVQPVKVFRA